MENTQMSVNDVFTLAAERIVDLNRALPLGDNVKLDEGSGLMICTVCGEPRQSRAKNPSGGTFTANVPCKCERDAEQARKENARRAECERKRAEVFGKNSKKAGFTFENDDQRNPEISNKVMSYVDGFEDYRKEGVGWLFYSSKNGGGKTFYACAIGNSLIDKGYKVKATSIMDLRDDLFRSNDKTAFLDDLCRYDLVLIDDLGTEQGGDFTIETEYRVIERLTDNNIPLLLTTNFTIEELTNHQSRDRRRIYDRVLGACLRAKVDPPNGVSRRLEKIQKKKMELQGDH